MMMERGLELEIFHSKIIHQKEIPLLISPSLLRSLGLGQIDIASFVRGAEGEFIIKLYEVKNSVVVKRGQRLRLQLAAEFLAKVFDLNVQLIYLFGAKEFCQTV